MNNPFCKTGSIELTYEKIPHYIRFGCNEITIKRPRVKKPLVLKRFPCENVSIGDCWICENMYVHITRNRTIISFKDEHYFLYHFTYGLFNNIPLGKLKYQLLRHRCDNSRCNNPNHLLPGTHTENMRDMVERQRSCFGEKNYNAQLDETAVRAILQSDYSVACLSEIYNVTESTIREIRDRKTWKHIQIEDTRAFDYLDDLL